jgi:hypothetical protein
MVEQQESAQKPGDILGVGLTRRQAVQAAGLAALGLTFGKPIIQTFYPKPAFASYQMADSTSLASTSDHGSIGHTGNPTSHESPSSNGRGTPGGSGGHNQGGSGGGGGHSLTTENPKGGSVSDPTAVLEPLGDNLVRFGKFSNRSKHWSFFNPHLPPGGFNPMPEMVPGEVYYIEVKGHQRLMLNGRLRNLYAGANYIVW